MEIYGNDTLAAPCCSFYLTTTCTTFLLLFCLSWNVYKHGDEKMISGIKFEDIKQNSS